LLIPQAVLLLQLAVFSLTRIDIAIQEVPIVLSPLFQLGVAAACLAGASVLLRRQRDDATIKCLEAGSVALLGLMVYYLTRHAFHVPEDVLFVRSSFFERAVATNVLYGFGALCLWFGRRFERVAIVYTSLVILGIAVYRTVVLDLLWDNPLFTPEDVGSIPILNSLLLAYLAPAGWIEVSTRLLRGFWNDTHLSWLRRFGLFLVFITVTFETRHAFHPHDMSEDALAGAEVYAYSIAWLAMALVMLFYGTLVKNRTLRTASLVLIVLTVCKVFLYDASELTGLYRVLSFLGLGVSLIGLYYFYNRFVFQATEPKPEPA
jgi:uncharacterized membrane protein